MFCIQVKALEKELIKRAEEQGLDIEPQIIVVTRYLPGESFQPSFWPFQPRTVLQIASVNSLLFLVEFRPLKCKD